MPWEKLVSVPPAPSSSAVWQPLCLPTCYLCEWGVISASTLWMCTHLNWHQCFGPFSGSNQSLCSKSYDYTVARSLLTSSFACPSLNTGHRLSSLVWKSTVCLWLDTFTMRSLFPAPYLTPSLARNPSSSSSSSTTSKLNYIVLQMFWWFFFIAVIE